MLLCWYRSCCQWGWLPQHRRRQNAQRRRGPPPQLWRSRHRLPASQVWCWTVFAGEVNIQVSFYIIICVSSSLKAQSIGMENFITLVITLYSAFLLSMWNVQDEYTGYFVLGLTPCLFDRKKFSCKFESMSAVAGVKPKVLLTGVLELLQWKSDVQSSSQLTQPLSATIRFLLAQLQKSAADGSSMDQEDDSEAAWYVAFACCFNQTCAKMQLFPVFPETEGFLTYTLMPEA